MKSRGREDDSGFTLVEVLLAVAILGISFAALLGGMQMTILGSDIHRQQASGQAVLVQAAESIKDESRNPQRTCADLVGGATYNPYTGLQNLPPGWAEANALKVVPPVRQWNGSAFVAVTSTADCAAPDAYKLQLITLRVNSPDGRASETASVVKKRP